MDQVLVVGNGDFAASLVSGLNDAVASHGGHVAAIRWDKRDSSNLNPESCGVVHVGSGRQFAGVVDFCNLHGAPLIEGSTDVDQDLPVGPRFSLVVAPNLAIPIVKFLHMLGHAKTTFSGHHIRILESHQHAKPNVSGTARTIASALGVDEGNISKVRDPGTQRVLLQVPASALDGHAIHQVEIEGFGATLRFETRVFGREAYCHGVLAVFAAMERLENGCYFVTELVDRGYL